MSSNLRNRLGLRLNLFFLALTVLGGCTQPTGDGVTIYWHKGHATAISISKDVLKNNSGSELQVRLSHANTFVLGSVSSKPDGVYFTPAIPFTSGLTYEIFVGQKFLEKIRIPADPHAITATLVAVYPSADTLPENLLKFYLAFSAPMQEGVAGNHVALLDKNGRELNGIFLDLQPELWNEERTVLTAWLDPGRIKRDLIPNKKFGNPLHNGERYTLVLRGGWRDAQGLPTHDTIALNFVASGRDSLSPQMSHWRLILPSTGTLTPLTIVPDETLDHYLSLETLQITDSAGNAINGTFYSTNAGRHLTFRPLQPWRPGDYRLHADLKLEDLAGNNLERIFDRDLQSAALPPAITVRNFSLRP